LQIDRAPFDMRPSSRACRGTAQAQGEDRLLMALRKFPHPELGAKRHVEGRNILIQAASERFAASELRSSRPSTKARDEGERLEGRVLTFSDAARRR
jgi:hypothetical protein